MFTSLLVVMLTASSSVSLQKFTLKPSPPAKRCVGSCAERYRLPDVDDDAITAKDRAMRQDGSKCNVVGAQRCLSKRRTIIRASLGE
ncbi:MAG: hypothetical protein V4459_13030 [Pseudomonadota bacterium]